MAIETPIKSFVGALVALIKTIQDKDSGKKKRKKAEFDVEETTKALFNLSPDKTGTPNVKAAGTTSGIRAAKKPAAKKPIIKKPVVKKSVAKKPAARKPTANKT